MYKYNVSTDFEGLPQDLDEAASCSRVNCTKPEQKSLSTAIAIWQALQNGSSWLQVGFKMQRLGCFLMVAPSRYPAQSSEGSTFPESGPWLM